MSFKIGSDNTYQRPPHKALDDNASFVEISDLANEIYDNLERLKTLKTQLKENDRNDKILQLMSLAGVLIGGALGLFFKLKKVQRLENQPKLQVVPGGSGKSVITMNNPALESQSYFGNSAF